MAKARQAVHEAHRIVVKVGSSSLTTATGGLDADRVDALVDVLAKHRSGGEKEIVLVSSGAIAAGLAPLGLRRRPKDLARQQAAASVGQGLLVARYTASCARHGVRVGQVLLTSDDTSRRAHHRNAARTLDKLLAMGALPVVNENDTTRRTRSASATTTGSPRSSPTSSGPTCWSCSPTWTACTTATPASPAPRG